MHDPAILAAHGIVSPASGAPAAEGSQTVQDAGLSIEEPDLHRRVVRVAPGDLLVVHAASAREPIVLTVRSRSGELVAVQTGRMPRIELVSENDDALLVAIEPAPGAALGDALASTQLMVTR